MRQARVPTVERVTVFTETLAEERHNGNVSALIGAASLLRPKLLVFGGLDAQAAGFDVAAALRLALGDEGRARVGAAKAMDLLERRRGAVKHVAHVLLQRGGSTLAECQRIVAADEIRS